ncbi:MAG: EAL domain-containing protein, partial [Deltaproteobacteria bacterium]
LSYLHRFPFDVLKIDRSFIRNLGVEKEGTEIVRSILFLAQRLDKVVIAEGVETEAQLAWLREAGCPYAQGYLFAKPLPPEEVEGYLAGVAGYVPFRLSAVESNSR